MGMRGKKHGRKERSVPIWWQMGCLKGTGCMRWTHLKLAEQRLLKNSHGKVKAARAAAAARFVSRSLASHICQVAFGGPVYFLYNPSIHFVWRRWSRSWLPLGEGGRGSILDMSPGCCSTTRRNKPALALTTTDSLNTGQQEMHNLTFNIDLCGCVIPDYWKPLWLKKII